MEKIKKMGDGVCCPVGEECPETEPILPQVPEVEHVNPYEVPYIPSSHVQELIARKEKKDKNLKIVQKQK